MSATEDSLSRLKCEWRLNFKNGSSKTWHVFLEPHDMDGNVATGKVAAVKCGLCLQIVKLNAQLSTSNMHQHLKEYHANSGLDWLEGMSERAMTQFIWVLTVL